LSFGLSVRVDTDDVSRRSRRQIFQRKLELFNLDRWLLRTSTLIGEYYAVDVRKDADDYGRRLNVHVDDQGTVTHVDHQ
jgi:hypothetical protein